MAPQVTLDYTEVFGYKNDSLTPEAYVETFPSPDMLGNPNVKTQHLLVASTVRQLSSTIAVAGRQIRAMHVLYNPDTKKEIARSSGHGVLQFTYEKVEGVWKIAGLKASNDFFDNEMRGVFPSFPIIELKL
ncbi:hypothetical protein M409DRAFT_21373 [Zasmidium cellare ATCC 36951]|uniref:Scytalone dehydratase-like domain-containing protein n=1 Tax=Zasmidium cellare ATCC 36951 TaxID=1080233 RepID=A0A6A6CR34_ZASCE|nr:uncharacterized protein M409DRAFT_21373 [Zasmidium cellare ATCC 36951]KAF2168628.1 hypothetical protein M409DRAFT_21373 [Zasmidium cellare ATCC 36951]